ncbi:MAG: TadE/TadG family type IV pilus assembly protein [Syntrophomonas sp.]
MGWLRRSRFENERGQSMVEMALVLPLLLALVMGMIEFGNLYATKIELNNLARQAVRTAVVGSPADDDDLEENLAGNLGMSEATVVITRPDADVKATVQYDAPLITGYIIGTGTKHLESVATMKAE